MKKFIAIIVFLSLSCSEKNEVSRVKVKHESSQAAISISTSVPQTRVSEKTADDWKKERIQLLKTEAKPEIQHFRVPSFSQFIPTENLSLQEAAALALRYFVNEPKTYSIETYGREEDLRVPPAFEKWACVQEMLNWRHTEILVAYGLLQNGNSPIGWQKELRAKVSRLWKDTDSRTIIYAKLRPSIRIAFRELSPSDRAAYLTILKHGSGYLKTFDTDKERKFLAKWKPCNDASYMSQKESEKCDWHFTSQTPEGAYSPYRKFEAFLFRRVTNDGWKVEDLKQMLDQLITDFS